MMCAAWIGIGISFPFFIKLVDSRFIISRAYYVGGSIGSSVFVRCFYGDYYSAIVIPCVACNVSHFNSRFFFCFDSVFLGSFFSSYG